MADTTGGTRDRSPEEARSERLTVSSAGTPAEVFYERLERARRDSPRRRLLLLAMLLVLLAGAMAWFILLAIHGGDEPADEGAPQPTPAEPTVPVESAPTGPAAGAVPVEVGSVTGYASVNTPEGSLTADATSPAGIDLQVDPGAKTLEGTIAVEVEQLPSTTAAPEETAQGSVTASFALPLLPLPPKPVGPNVSVEPSGTEHTWYVGGEVDVTVSLEGRRAISISETDGVVTAEYTDLAQSTTTTGWLQGGLDPADDGTWSLSFNLRHEPTPGVDPAWYVTLDTWGTVPAPDLPMP
jgi:hypothetical protein